MHVNFTAVQSNDGLLRSKYSLRVYVNEAHATSKSKAMCPSVHAFCFCHQQSQLALHAAFTLVERQGWEQP